MTERLAARPWDDDRLVAAFTARDRMRPLPDPLVASTLDLVAAERRPVAVRMAGRYRPALVMLGVVALVGGLAIADWRASTGVPTVTTGPIQTAGASLPTAGPTTGPAATPSDGSSARPGDDSTTALGLPIISVSDAIAIRDAGVDDQELAVRGWFSPAGLSAGLDRFCGLILKLVLPVQNGCGDGFVWLTQDAERLARNVGGSIEFGPPKGPAIQPSFAQVDADWWHNVPELNARSCGVRATCSASPTNIVSIVAIGHFDDRRAPLCAVNAATQCRDRFVVDRVDSVGAKPVDLSVIDNVAGDRVWTVDDVRQLDPLGPEEHRLSIEVVSGRDKSLVIEPTLLDDPAWSRQPAVWLIRDLYGQRVVTHVLADGSSRVFDMHDDGTVTVLPGPLPASHDAPWPPLGSILAPTR